MRHLTICCINCRHLINILFFRYLLLLSSPGLTKWVVAWLKVTWKSSKLGLTKRSIKPNLSKQFFEPGFTEILVWGFFIIKQFWTHNNFNHFWYSIHFHLHGIFGGGIADRHSFQAQDSWKFVRQFDVFTYTRFFFGTIAIVFFFAFDICFHWC